jgi:iron complex outermembrane receptor protein
MHFTATCSSTSVKYRPGLTKAFDGIKLACLCLLLIVSCRVSAQVATNGALKGTVKTADGKAAEYVNITITETSQGAVTTQSGHYMIKNIKPGNYTLVASFMGLQTQTREVAVAAGETTTINFVLSEGGKQLQEVYVKSAKHNKFLKKETGGGGGILICFCVLCLISFLTTN